MSCQKQTTTTLNHFSSATDTLVLQTTKQKGDGFFEIGVTGLEFMKVDSVFPYQIQYPKGLDRMERGLFLPNLLEKRPFYVDIVKGTQNGIAVVVVDENNNKDLTDDTVRTIEPMLWNADQKVIPCEYDFFNGKEIIQGSSWLKIGTFQDNLLFGRSDHVVANFSIDSQEYTITAADPFNLSFSFDVHPKLAIITQKDSKKDSISYRDLLSLGEFLKLKDSYYKFQTISSDGKRITLIKEENFDTKIGTQVGMKAPEFTVITTENDTIQSVNLHNKRTIIANSCGCGGDKASTQAYYDMRKAYTDFHIFRVDSHIKETNDGLHIDAENEFNKNFYEQYRKQYCSRICYVIGTDHRIIDKFVITNWETALQHLVY
ncbi:MAG: hypothetical protein AAF611_16440 [Bacteroidota bacterium]